jgi:dipeptidyl aminopeptidase/acylaminoacyl peptidase
MIARYDGQLLAQTPLALDDQTLARLAQREPTIHARLAQVELFELVYHSDGLRIKALLARPQGAGPYPCLIYNRGGNRDFGALGPADAATVLARIAAWGYVVVASQYRGALGGEGADEFGGADVADVLNLLPLLDRQPGADTARIGMWGWSRGGLMTYRALAATDRLSAAIVVAGLADAFDYMARRPDMEREVFAELVPGYAQNRATELERRSPIRWAARLCKRTPILLLHGGADWRVHPSQSLRMAQALFDHTHPFRLVFLEGGDHALAEHRDEMFEQGRAWLARYLRDQQPWPSLEPHGL